MNKRKFLIAGNWKMNGGPLEAAELFEGIKNSKKEISESGCNFVLVGHSERRQYFAETDETVNKKVVKALSEKLAPVICIGETLEQRKENIHFDLVSDQITAALKGITSNDALDTVVAYEPVWAIGTGETATPEQAQEMHKFIRQELEKIYDEETASAIRILYGGSMKPGNAKELLSQDDVDGGLIGGASLSAESFTEIISIAEELS